MEDGWLCDTAARRAVWVPSCGGKKRCALCRGSGCACSRSSIVEEEVDRGRCVHACVLMCCVCECAVCVDVLCVCTTHTSPSNTQAGSPCVQPGASGYHQLCGFWEHQGDHVDPVFPDSSALLVPPLPPLSTRGRATDPCRLCLLETPLGWSGNSGVFFLVLCVYDLLVSGDSAQRVPNVPVSLSLWSVCASLCFKGQ